MEITPTSCEKARMGACMVSGWWWGGGAEVGVVGLYIMTAAIAIATAVV